MLEFFSLLKTVARKIIVKGLTSSIGWNLGKENISIHLFEPFISIPIIGTKTKKNKEMKNKKIDNLKRYFLFKEEKKIKTITPMQIYAKCLKKKK